MNVALILVLVLLWGLRAAEIRLCQRCKHPGRVSGKGRRILLLMILGSALVNLYLVVELLCVSREFRPALLLGGTMLLGARVLLKLWAVRSLGGFWSADVEIRENHRLVREGPYRVLRHPAYLANLLEALAYPLLAHSPAGLVLMSVLVLPALLLRIRVEERELERKFGESFLAYKADTWAFIPFIA
jgi:protein-S-isoprenylcysteine O-methyltransferase Ste14